MAILRNLLAKLNHPAPIAQTTPFITMGLQNIMKNFSQNVGKVVHESFQEAVQAAKNGQVWTHRERNDAPPNYIGSV